MCAFTLNEAILEYIPKLEGWSSEAKCLALANIIIENKVQTSVEIGVWGGRGLISMAMAHRELEHLGYPKTCAYGIDPWAAQPSLEGRNDPENDKWWASVDYEGIYEGFIYNVGAHNLKRWCTWYRKKSAEVVGKFKPMSIGLMHQDGNHSEEVSCAEVEQWAPLIKRGGFWVFDDAKWPTTQKAQRELLAKGFVVTSDHEDWKIFQKPR